MIYATLKPLIPQARPLSQPGKPHIISRAGTLLGRAGIAIWQWLEDIGQARANRELRQLADRWELTNPEYAGQIRAASSYDSTSRGNAHLKSSQSSATPNGAAGSGS